ncbi:alpha-amylase family protein [uncultured Paraglaciecola sp.]|uniref:alpha-amylase family protein n=1 Tax=uncultured Paraglaciecola sp. TaxID=1765024 RepID=UPI00260BCC74|nr:alpha-amylase family protein [uncultured Paraglaciecola sp.]
MLLTKKTELLFKHLLGLSVLSSILACSPLIEPQKTSKSNTSTLPQINAISSNYPVGKPVVYQVFTRLFGNTNTTNQPWGSIEENGVGKFSDFNDAALLSIKELGTSHIWYTGVPHHDVITDYSAYGINHDDPDVVKGRAGSPYAVKDYYSVNPDLAQEPANRIAEFEALIARTHKHGMQVIIDIVPNHVARNYQSLGKPQGIKNFGELDNTNFEYARNNNFYYVVAEDFKVPEPTNGYQPLGGESHPLADGKFNESPAKWTGNGSRKAQPDANDWYETVKVNYGVKPDGSYDFATLPQSYRDQDVYAHAAFWADKDVPDSWKKFRDITHYWLDKGVDGFRYDMAEMVPVEFWSYLNSSIKIKNPQAFLLAEVYNPSLYRDYIQLGKMDYLYDKVEFYDELKAIMQGKQSAEVLHQIQAKHQDIEQHLLHFLENHDEQRIASPDFAGKVGGAEMGKPALVVSALISRSPTLLYFGQELGEDGSEDLGFGDPTRTSIFDYGSVPTIVRWNNQGMFDGGLLTKAEQQLQQYYRNVMQISATHPAVSGQYMPIMPAAKLNKAIAQQDLNKVLAFVRYQGDKRFLVVSHFSHTKPISVALNFDAQQISVLGLDKGTHQGLDLLTGQSVNVDVQAANGEVLLNLAPMQSMVIEL